MDEKNYLWWQRNKSGALRQSEHITPEGSHPDMNPSHSAGELSHVSSEALITSTSYTGLEEFLPEAGSSDGNPETKADNDYEASTSAIKPDRIDPVIIPSSSSSDDSPSSAVSHQYLSPQVQEVVPGPVIKTMDRVTNKIQYVDADILTSDGGGHTTKDVAYSWKKDCRMWRWKNPKSSKTGKSVFENEERSNQED